MDVSSKEFTLNFRGFEHNDPETVKRFTAFCEANFALSPNTFGDVNENAETVVLTQGESPEALEALAQVLREIGARVEVSQGFNEAEASSLSAPSTQELHRLFGHLNEDGSSYTDGPSCPYPPLGRTLYLLTQSDGVFDRRRLRPKTYRSEARRKKALQEEARHETETPAPGRHHAILVASAISLCVGLLTLIAAALLAKSFQVSLNGREGRSFLQSREQNETTKSDLPLKDIPPARTLTASARIDWFTIDVKVLASSRSLSLSALTLTPSEGSQADEGSVIKKIVGDPTFLTEVSPGEWSGQVQLSVFIDTDGQESHMTIPARVSVKVSNDNAAGSAILEIANEASNRVSDENRSLGTRATARLATFAVSGLELS
jgi:hypothetical protein